MSFYKKSCLMVTAILLGFNLGREEHETEPLKMAHESPLRGMKKRRWLQSDQTPRAGTSSCADGG